MPPPYSDGIAYVRIGEPMRRTAATLFAALLVATALVLPSAGPAQADDSNYTCSQHWHFIRHAQLNRNVEPSGTEPSEFLQATGVQSADYWNQEVLFCADYTAWGLLDTYRIYSNRTAGYWSTDSSNVNRPLYGNAYSFLDNDNLFTITSYDGHYSLIKSVSAGYVYANASDGGNLYANRSGFLGGDNLWVITPADLLA